MRVIRQTMIAAAVAAFTSTAAWAQPEFCNFANATSDASTGVTSVSCTLTGGYTLGDIDWDGFASTINNATWGNELDVEISGPLGTQTITLGAGQTYDPGAQFTGTSGAFAGAGDPAGLWTFDFHEGFDDGTDGIEDAVWDTIDFTFNEFGGPPPPPATVAQLTYDPNGPATKYQGTLGLATVDFIELTILDDGTTLEINTAKTFAIPFEDRVDDTEIGIYDSLGNLIDNNDDISFPSNPYSKLELTLDAGTYYLAVGEYNTVFGSTGWGAAAGSPPGADGGQYWINIIPEPGTALLLGLGVVGLIRRRR